FPRVQQVAKVLGSHRLHDCKSGHSTVKEHIVIATPDCSGSGGEILGLCPGGPRLPLTL
ncbi:MAG: hypothetical protein QOG46_516, partial [Pseudonocardiales bacterium]|nr:hypothetical protein [Pseudonocardiales bacterium]